jgi:dTDP-4-amino-4,6-dideoxygalactose transaminase
MTVMTTNAYQSSGTPDLALRPDEAWPFYAEDEIAAVVAVLRSGKVNQWTGPDVFEFEKACTERFGGGHGIALANGSLALELPLRAFGIGPGDEVVVTPRTFAASAFCVMLVGATPVFADVDPDSGNITAETIARVLTDRTRAIIPVHLGGWPADMPAIMELARSRKLAVIEDCAQAHGASIHGRSVGSFGDAAAFSFCQDKIISTAGEGGFVSLRTLAEWNWARSFKDHGKNWEKHTAPSVMPGLSRLVHDSVGTNWRLTGPQAAVGLKQLEKLGEWTEIRSRNARIWADALRDVRGLRVPLPAPGIVHALYKFYFYVDAPEADAPRLRNEILRRGAEARIKVQSGSCSEIYLEEAFRDLPAPDCPVARAMSGNSLMVEVHPTLRPGLLEQRAGALASICSEILG